MRSFPFLFLILLAAPLRAQDLGARLGGLDRTNAEGFAAPLARALGRTLSTGFAAPPDPRGGLGFALGVRVSAASFLPAEDRFEVEAPSTVVWSGIVWKDAYAASDGGRSPTVSGSGRGGRLTPRPGSTFRRALEDAGEDPDASEFALDLPEGLGLRRAPIATIEGTLAIGLGTQIAVRASPTLDLGGPLRAEGIGDVTTFGIGVTHGLAQWLPGPPPPWDLALLLAVHRLTLGDYAEARGSTLGLMASCAVGPLSLYALGASTRGRVDFDYRVSNPSGNPALPPNDTRVTFATPFDRAARFSAGATVRLPHLRLGAEYGFGDGAVLSGGAAFDFR